ncbi:Ppx/GppA phosphatase family protein [soil metagenome]
MTRLAALDLGSNSFHLLVADTVAGSTIKRVVTRKLTLRLAEPVARDGELGRDGRRRAGEAFAELVALARDAGAHLIAAVGTQALRQAGDSVKLRERLFDRHGIEVTVISGLQEGYLSLRGMHAALRVPADAELLGFDLGGGSFEVSYGRAGPLAAAASLPLGAAAVRDRLRHDPPRFLERVDLHADALAQLQPVAREVSGLRGERAAPPRAAATAGTIRDLGRLGLALALGAAPERVRGVVVTRDQLERAYTQVCTLPTGERLSLPGISDSRADLLPAGGTVLLAAMAAFDLEHLELCDWGLREGLLLDALSDGEVVHLDDFQPV